MKTSSLFCITLASVALASSVTRAEKLAQTIAPGELNLGAMLQPVPLPAKFINDSSYLWCGSLVLFYSLDGLDWKLAKHPLVSDLNLKWADGTTQKLHALERPQLFFEKGKPVSLLCAAQKDLNHSFNVQIPLKSQ